MTTNSDSAAAAPTGSGGTANATAATTVSSAATLPTPPAVSSPAATPAQPNPQNAANPPNGQASARAPSPAHSNTQTHTNYRSNYRGGYRPRGRGRGRGRGRARARGYYNNTYGTPSHHHTQSHGQQQHSSAGGTPVANVSDGAPQDTGNGPGGVDSAAISGVVSTSGGGTSSSGGGGGGGGTVGSVSPSGVGGGNIGSGSSKGGVSLPTGIVSFIGAGNMARALIGGLLGRGMEPGKIRASARTTRTLDRLRGFLPDSMLYLSNVGVVSGASLVVLCVKPDGIEAVVQEIAASLRPGAVIVSVAAGVPVARIEQALSDALPHSRSGTSGTSELPHPVVRAMPNMAAAVRHGATALSGRFESAQDAPPDALALFAASGPVTVVEERLLPAVTCISGAGIAYCLMLAEALADAGVAHGLPRDVARDLAAATVEGAGALATGQPTAHFAMLRNGIESPGGVTIAATAQLERSGLRAAMHDAVDKAMQRIELIEDKYKTNKDGSRQSKNV